MVNITQKKRQLFMPDVLTIARINLPSVGSQQKITSRSDTIIPDYCSSSDHDSYAIRKDFFLTKIMPAIIHETQNKSRPRTYLPSVSHIFQIEKCETNCLKLSIRVQNTPYALPILKLRPLSRIHKTHWEWKYVSAAPAPTLPLTFEYKSRVLTLSHSWQTHNP